jgi:hypothetical protein
MLDRPEVFDARGVGERSSTSSQEDGTLGWLLVEYGLDFAERGVWLVVGQAVGAYGWKLHLSSVQVQAQPLLRMVLPILAASRVPFKVARNLTVLALLNEGALGDTQVGKFVTIYPPDIASARAVCRKLIEATQIFVGPRIITDRHLGTVVYARYGAFSPPMRRNRLGLFEPADREEGIAAAYKIPFAPPDGYSDPFRDFTFTGGLGGVVTYAESIRPIGPGYLITGLVARHAKGCVYQAVDLRDRRSIRTVVLKEGRMHCMSDAEGRAMAERIDNQAQAHALAAAVNAAPAVHPTFRFGDSVFLPLDYIQGRDLGARPATPLYRLTDYDQRSLLTTLTAAGRALYRLHRAGVIHRDLSMRNIRISDDGAVYLLDLEIAHIIPTDPLAREAGEAVRPFMQGTPGFVSPQQLAGASASMADDVFAFGAVLVCALTGLDPQRVIFAQAGMNQEARTCQFAELSGAPLPLCQIMAAAIAESRDERPSIAVVIDILAATVISPGTSCIPVTPPDRSRFAVLAHEGARWLVGGVARDAQTGMWKSPDIEASNHADIDLIHAFKVYRSANVGVAGVAYTLSKLVRLGFNIDGAGAEIANAIDWLLDHHPTADDQMTGLHFGEAGVALAIAEALAAGVIERGQWTAAYYREVFAAPIDWPDLTHGAAGQGMGALACAALLSNHPDIVQAAMACVDRCAEYLCDEQAGEGCWVLPAGVSEMSGRPYTGLAHGAAGALAFLSHSAVYGTSGVVRDAAARAANWLMENARAGERGLYLWWPMTPDEPRAWSWWCHGGPGIAVGLLAHHRATGDDRYGAAARAALRGQPFEARHPNLSQCHGLAGIGEIYLDAYRLLHEDEWLGRALAIGSLLANLARKGESGASWLVENPYVPTPDLMIGNAGVVHFLARLSRLDDTFDAPLSPPVTVPRAMGHWTS